MKPNRSILKLFSTSLLAMSAGWTSVVAGTWRTAAPIPTPRLGAVSGVVNGKLYVAGGATGYAGTSWMHGPFDLIVPNLEIYDPETDSWSEGPPMPLGTLWAMAGVVNDKLLVLGGLTSFRADALHVQEYDPATDSWTVGPETVVAGFAWNCGAAGIATKIYVVCPTYMGEYDAIDRRWSLRYRLSPDSTPTSWIFDPFPNRNDFVVQELDEKLFAIGGRAYGSPSPDLDLYDTRTGAWLAGAPMLTARSFPSAGVIDGKIFVAGGANVEQQGLPTLEEYDPANDVWTVGPDMPTPRFNAASGVIDGSLYVVGGFDHLSRYEYVPALSVVEVYDPESRRRERRVCVCHDDPGDQEPPRKLCVGASAAQVHVRLHGDTLGGCGLLADLDRSQKVRTTSSPRFFD